MMFQCPTSGFSLFYETMEIEVKIIKGVFQCPTSGFSLFYYSKGNRRSLRIYVSMPYFGLFSFLHYGSTTLDFAGFANPFLRVII